MLTDNTRHQNVPPPLDLKRVLKSCLKRNDTSKFLEKEEQTIPQEINCAVSLVKNDKSFSRKRASKWILVFLSQTDTF